MKTNEETIYEGQAISSEAQSESSSSKKVSSKAGRWAYAAGGAVGGAGMASGINAFAHKTVPEAEVEEVQDDIEEVSEEVENDAPSAADNILETSQGVKVAHVDDDLSFSEAFAEARSQVGPGGVFEWRGKVYGTFYESEWNSMSDEEKSDYWNSIDYDEVRSDSAADVEPDTPEVVIEGVESNVDNSGVDIAYGTIDGHDMVMQDNDGDGMVDVMAVDLNDNGYVDYGEVEDVSMYGISMPNAGPAVASTSYEPEIEILDVASADLDGDGHLEDIAVISIDGEEVALVDVNGDGIADIGLADTDGDGYIADNEVLDLTGENLGMPQMSAGDMYLAMNDDMPDYMNDADTGLYTA